jgi:lysozyme family protein
VTSLFDQTLAHVLEMEGLYANVPGDSGGETWRGVSRASNPSWEGWRIVDAVKAQGFIKAAAVNRSLEGSAELNRLVADVYREKYWAPLAKWLEGRVLAKVFDTGVNMGVGTAVRLLQQALNHAPIGAALALDGALGPKTQAAAKAAPEDRVLENYRQAQSSRYLSLAEKPSQRKFLAGWLRRAAWLPPKESA